MFNNSAKCEMANKIQEIVQREITDYSGVVKLEFHIQGGNVALLKIGTEQYCSSDNGEGS